MCPDSSKLLADLEGKVLEVLDPPLNLGGRPWTPVRQRLTELRSALSQAPVSATGHQRPSSARHMTRPAAERDGQRVTLHEEVEAILRENGDWMTTDEIASAVYRRSRYAKKDGSAVTAFQIHGRTKNYAQLFVREGSRVGLRNPWPGYPSPRWDAKAPAGIRRYWRFFRHPADADQSRWLRRERGS